MCIVKLTTAVVVVVVVVRYGIINLVLCADVPTTSPV
jgi:hypothetical protein